VFGWQASEGTIPFREDSGDMRLDLNAIVNEFILQSDPLFLQKVMDNLGPRECHEVQERFIDIRGKEALETVRKAETKKRK
jgi:hypothetical protein